MDFQRYHNALKQEFEKHLQHVFDNIDVPKSLIDAMNYSLQSGGKRLRPILMFHMAKTLHVDEKVALPLCSAIEMIHTYSLIHDDLPAMDNDSMRRGKPTSHIKFGEDMAILAGDGLLNTAFEIMLKNTPKEDVLVYLKAVQYIVRCAGVSGMIGGQVMDIQGVSSQYEDLKMMHMLKTGKLFSACIMPMVYLAGLSDEITEIYMKFCDSFGLLFQITDDILDVIGDKENLGKSVGKDEDMNKVTYVSIFGIDAASQMADEALDTCLNLIDQTEMSDAYLTSLVKNIRQRNN